MKRFAQNAFTLPTAIGAIVLAMTGALIVEAQAAAPTCTLSALPSAVTPEGHTTLTWSSTNATSLVFNQNAGTSTSVAAGSLSVEPTSTPTTYTGTFTGPGGTIQCETTVTGAPVGLTTEPTPSFPALTTPTIASTTTTTVTVTPVILTTPAVDTDGPMPTVVQVNNTGNVLLRGIVTGVSSTSFTVASWGGSWTIIPDTGASLTPSAGLTSMVAGDFVGVAGTVSLNESWTINASVVHDWTQSPPAATQAMSATTTSEASSSSSSDVLYTGVASNVSTSSFVLTDANGNAYTVNVTPNATIWNSAGSVIPLSTFAAGDSIRLDGQLQNDGSISADVVRDTSQ